MQIVEISLSDIEIGQRMRPATDAYVEGLARDIGQRGLRTPIEVARADGDKPYKLVSGRHRLAAVEALGLETITASVVEGSDSDLRRDELLENLQRNELSRLERCVFVAEFRKLYLAEHPETANGGDRRSEDFQNPTDRILKQWWEDLAVRSERSRSTIMREATIGGKLEPAVVEKIRGTVIEDNVKELEQLADYGAVIQVRIAKLLADETKGIKTVKAAAKEIEPSDDESEKTPDQIAFERLMANWRSASPDVQSWFVAALKETGAL